ncbi:carboxymuconolactone decarboxylase family protein [Rhizobacter sp. J219]|uniref:carboxymuconolactone decarboxylase family protein n=1 Tax=Rhizobacter sp. J219 TaxID=2898430 RepID=UPI002150A114|nr:carboxymuconolactone decarboxylase family protein [Rhizobacter sp. J219]MCR5883965.1 carboxymuconolactone decarboxylase family protein [Rhizobacter sp. J219]
MDATPARIAPAMPPFPPDIQRPIDLIMPPGVPPLVLFTTLARDPRLFGKFFAASLLDRGHLTLRQRELVIHRTTALCGSEYEWGVHVRGFAAKAGLDAAQLASTVHGTATDACWSDEDRVLIRLCDALHRNCDVDDTLWAELSARFSEPACIELLMLAGFYRTVAYLTNGLRLPLETMAARFPAAA